MTVFVISKFGERLMPTTRLGKVRHLLKDGKASIVSRNPFTIKLEYETKAYTQDIELGVDAGYQHIGVSIKSEKQEYVSHQYDLLTDEKKNHDTCRKLRRTRRNRKTRYRKPRFNNRKASKPKGWFAPSVKNKADRHIDLILRFCAVAPITRVYIEEGQFDTQVLQAVAEGKPIPEGVDYQHGPQYGIDTLREAVFQRDNYTCRFCKKSSFKDGAILHAHHLFFWKGRHGNRLDELGACCSKCHTSANHKEGGLLWGYDKELANFEGAAFMNTVRKHIYKTIKEMLPSTEIHVTYGAVTKRSRLDLKLEKSHVNDAFSMGMFHPEKRAEEMHYQKRRRNNRCLEKFYDAKYIDIRDGSKKTGADLGCQRTNRRERRITEKNLRIYHGKKISKGRRSIREKRYSLRPEDKVVYNNKAYTVKGIHNKGKSVLLSTGKSVALSKITTLWHAGSWTPCAALPGYCKNAAT